MSLQDFLTVHFIQENTSIACDLIAKGYLVHAKGTRMIKIDEFIPMPLGELIRRVHSVALIYSSKEESEETLLSKIHLSAIVDKVRNLYRFSNANAPDTYISLITKVGSTLLPKYFRKPALSTEPLLDATEELLAPKNA